MNTFRRRLSGYQWEILLAILILVAAGVATAISPYYLDAQQIFRGLRFVIIPGLLALALTVIVIQGEIDISLPSAVAVGTVLLGSLAQADVPYPIAIAVVAVAGVVLGLINGAIVTSFGLPSMAVTLGTLGAYRGLAYLLPGGNDGFAADVFAPEYLWLGKATIGGLIPVSLIAFLVFAVLFGLLVHRTTYGRLTYAIGNNVQAARYSGTRVGLIKIAAYVMGGVMAMVGALVFVGQYESARGDNLDGQLLFVVAAVVLAGIDMNGGRGKILGVVLSIVLLGTLYNGMGLANINAPIQVVVFGGLLIVSVLIPFAAGRAQTWYAARRATSGATP